MIPAVWTALYAEEPLDRAIRILNGHGWTAFEASTEHIEEIELAPDGPARIERARQVLADGGWSMPQAHALLHANVADADPVRRQETLDRLLRQIDVAGRLGVQNVVLHPGRGDDTRTRSGHRRLRSLNVSAFRQLGDAAGERGMRIGIENLSRAGCSVPWELLDLLDAIDHPAIGITLDTSHAHMIDLDIPTAIAEWGPYLIATHISDNDGSGDQHLTPGGGTIDWPPVVEALRKAGYRGLFNLEIPGERHPVLGLRALKSCHAQRVATWLLEES